MKRKTPLTKLPRWLAIPLLALLALLVLGACAPADSGDDEASTEAETESSDEYEADETAAAVTDEIVDDVAAAALGLQVKTRLLEELGGDFLDVDVETAGSTVILRGEVNTEPRKETANEIALAVDGVDEVRNQLEVAETETSTPVADGMAEAETEVRDAVLESRVKTQLLREIGTNAFDIEVEANAGTVTLRGTAPDAEREEIALETARDVSGAEEVIDLIEVEDS